MLKDGVARGITALHTLQRFQLEKKNVLQKIKLNIVNQKKKNLICHLTSVALRIRDVYPGSDFFPSRIQGGQDHGSRVDKIQNPGSDFFHTGSRIQG